MNSPTKLKLYNGTRAAVSLFFPNRCAFCGKIIKAREFWCGECPKHLPYIGKELEPPENISKMTACCYYSRRARQAVHTLKFGLLIYPADAFGKMISEKISAEMELDGYDALVPVPSGKKSVKKRGFASAELIAKRVSMYTSLPVVKALKAVPDKAEQKSLSAKKRYINALNSFYTDEKAEIKGKRLILIDDVSTTGSTISAAAGLLLKAGAAEVACAVFAKTRGPSQACLSARRFVRVGRVSNIK